MYGDTNYSKEDREKQKQNKGMLKDYRSGEKIGELRVLM